MSLLPIFIIVVTATVALAVVGTLRKNGNSTQRQPNQNVDPATAPPTNPAGSANTGTAQVTTAVKNKWFILIAILVPLLLFSIPVSIWSQISSDRAIAKTVVIVITAIIIAGCRNTWSEELGKKLVGRLAFLVVVIAVGALLYQRSGVNVNEVKACLPSLPVAGATPATIPAPTATAPKATADEGKGTVVDVPEKVPGDNAWKHAYIFQLKSGYFRFSWDITAVDPKDRDVNWEIRLEKTGQVVSLTDIRSGKVKNPAIPQNGWIRIRAERPIKVKVSTAW